MANKLSITITVAGPAGSGKSTIMSLIANQLEGFDIEVTQRPYPGEPVVTGKLADRLESFADRITVTLIEKAARG